MSTRELESTRRELAALRAEFQRVQNSGSFRLGRLLTSAARSPRELIRLPGSLFRLWRDTRCGSRQKVADAEQLSAVKGRVDAFVRQFAQTQPSHIVFLFSGTTFIQGTRGNRPIRQALTLLRQGVPVLFSYHRSRVDDPLPADHLDDLVQIPVDISLPLLPYIARADYGGARKLFIVSYPYPGVPESVDLFRRHGWIVLYDCRDDWEEFARVGMARWFSSSVEQQLVSSCDETLCVSNVLCEKMQTMAPGSRVRLSPNAVESGFLPDDYSRQPANDPRVVGYFGHLSAAWFDWDAFIEIARRCPQFDFEVIGHSEPQDLVLPSNVTLLGPVPWEELHRYAARWNAAIITFRQGSLADAVDPIKIYEYLALGLPVVSLRMPQIANYPSTQMVSSVDEFCDALVRAVVLVPDSEEIRAFLARNTWEVRVRELLSLADQEAA